MGRVEDIWFGRGSGAAVARLALWPLARVYGAAMSIRGRLHDARLLHEETPDLPAISVGNLTVGGTGKTPFAAWLAARIGETARPAIVLRGYGDDEPEVHRRLNPGMPIVANPDRGRAIRDAKALGATIVVLDDAFQHRRIAREAEIVLFSAEQLMRPRRLLPAGPWREPIEAARRADLLVVTRKSATPSDTEHAKAVLGGLVPGVPIAVVHLAPKQLRGATGEMSLPIERLDGAHVTAIAAIGEPELFRRQLESLGAGVSMAAFRDHHAFSDAEIRDLALRVPADGIAVCTLKDAVKLAGRWPGPSRLWYVSQHLVVDEGVETIDRLLKRVLDARAAAASTAG